MSKQPRLVGRADELGRLAGWVAEVAAGYGRGVLVEGEPGIGKSALLAAAAHAAADVGCAVYQGAGEELGQGFPHRPLLDAFDIRQPVADPRRQAVLAALRESRLPRPAPRRPRRPRLAGDAAGNPLYITELVAALDRGDGLALTRGTVEVTGGPAPATLTEAISDRLRFLPETTRQEGARGDDGRDEHRPVYVGRGTRAHPARLRSDSRAAADTYDLPAF